MNTQHPGITYLWPTAAPSSFLGAHANETARRTAQQRLQEILSISRAPSPSGPVQRFLQVNTGSWIDLREIVDWTRSDGVKAEPEKYWPAVVMIIRDSLGWVVGAQVMSISGSKSADHAMASVVVTTVDDLIGPRWPLQTPPPLAGQTPPGRTGKLSVISAGARKARGGLFKSVAFALEFEQHGAVHESIQDRSAHRVIAQILAPVLHHSV